MADTTYRKKIDFETVESDEVESGSLYILVDEVDNIIDSIESEVNAIFDTIKNIEGLTEIDEIKTMLENLSVKLY